MKLNLIRAFWILFSICIQQFAFAQHDHEATENSSTMEESEPMMNDVEMDSMNHADMNHSTMDSTSMDSTTMDHSMGETMDHETMDHSEMDHGAMHESKMNHSNMDAMNHDGMDMSSMQGGSAPADARDPHAYSGGYTLESGPYSLPAVNRPSLADEHNFWAINFDRFEAVDTEEGGASVFDAQIWYGLTYNKFVIKTEGEVVDGSVEEIQNDLLWSHAISGFWDVQAGVRLDGGEGPNRNWLALGLQGLAPYWFEVDSTFYIGESGRTALQIEAEYDLFLSQRLVLQPRAELNVYGKDDPELGIGSGLSSAATGLRLRYEFSRQFAPYLGVEWQSTFGTTADFVDAAGGDSSETQWLAGVKFWF